MTEKELREIKRRFRQDKNNILSIKGCLVNSQKVIVTHIDQPMASCSVEEGNKLLGIMKKTLSGSLGTNLLDLEFTAQQVMDGAENKLLRDLRDSRLKDEAALDAFYQRIIDSVHFEESFAILLAFDTYDVFQYSADGQKQEDSSSVFNYFVCCVCPVKPLNSGLYFREHDSSFRDLDAHAILGAPELGFMFPAFDGRAANIYNTLYYTKDISDIHTEFIQNIFNVELPMAPAEQTGRFKTCLAETLVEECDFDTVRSVHSQISEMVQEHKEAKEEEPLRLTKSKLKTVLQYCGVDEEKVESFGQRFTSNFGEDAELPPKSIVNVNKFEVATPNVTIKVDPEHTDLVSTQIINGVKYILIRANDGVEVNGMNIEIK